MRKQVVDEEWRQMINQQAELNKQIIEEEKVLEKAKKELLIQQYQDHKQSQQRSAQENAHKRMQEQSEMDEKIKLYRGDVQSQLGFQKDMKNVLSNNYRDQMAQKRLIEDDYKKQKLQDEQSTIERAQQSLQYEQEAKFKQRQQAKAEMLNFYNNKKLQENEKNADRNLQKQEYHQMMQQQAQIQQVKEENYKRYYQQLNDMQSNAAKNFVPFDNDKERRIQDIIERGIIQDNERYKQQEEIRKQNLLNRRLDLKTGLQQQLASKERNALQKKQDFLTNQNDILSRSLEQRQYEDYQRNRQIQSRIDYKSLLDQQKHQNTQSSDASPLKIGQKIQTPSIEENIKTLSSKPSQHSLEPSRSAMSMIHNPLLNPVPNNIQNPYILKQLAVSPSMHQLTQGRMNYANLASSSIMTPKNNVIF